MAVAAAGGGDGAADGIVGVVGEVAGAVAEWFSVQVTSLEEYQKKLARMLQDVEAQLTKVDTTDSCASFGTFSEGQALYASYISTKQDLIAQFHEVSQLIDAMVTSLGRNANNYTVAEEQIQSQFTSILASYGQSPIEAPAAAPARSSTSTSSTSTLMGNL